MHWEIYLGSNDSTTWRFSNSRSLIHQVIHAMHRVMEWCVRCSQGVLFRCYVIPCFGATATFKVQSCIRTCSIGVVACIRVKTDLKVLGHWALIWLPLVWFPASNKVLYVGSCTTYTVYRVVLYEKCTASNKVLYANSCTMYTLNNVPTRINVNTTTMLEVYGPI
ncbi:hypothetical protein K492DRAFT_30272 [Lichtheimia hyalospora FSU 10163]|nr:hypothetical protein K492DRAFT_30272 [Lichtheimia hyalospora FSU 10163]